MGNRKIKVVFITYGLMTALVVAAFVTGVRFTGDQIIALNVVYATLGGLFFGANFGEHYARAKEEREAAG